jgi:predicted nucleotidyltransferase component of viral defense system
VIPAPAITAWGLQRPWPNRAAVEQDLLLARTIVAIYEHPLLAEELVFRGGTCLHQVHLLTPRRYSEDLDFVRRTHARIGRSRPASSTSPPCKPWRETTTSTAGS